MLFSPVLLRFKRKPIFQFGLYLAVGVGNTILTLCLMAIFKLLGLHYTLYTAIGYGAGFLNSYYWNSRLTFRARQLGGRLFLRFLVANLALLGITELLQIMLISGMNMPEIPSVIAGMGFYTLAGFALNKRLLSPVQQE